MPPVDPPAGTRPDPAALPPAEAMRRAFAAAQAGATPDAERLCRAVLAAHAGHFEALFLLGTLAGQAQRYEESARLLAQAVAVNDGSANTHNNLGNAQRALLRLDDALASYDRALALKPDHGDALYNRGIVLAALGRNTEALAACDRALALRPDFALAHGNRGVALHALGRHDDALAACDRALALDQRHAGAHVNRAVVLRDMGRLPEALASYERALALDPEAPFVYGDWLHTRMRMCEWSDLDRHVTRLSDSLARGDRVAPPFMVLATPVSAALQRRAAEVWVAHRYPARHALPPFAPAAARERLRVAYVSPDFREHPVAHLIVDVLERHDKARCETIALSIGAGRDDPMRRRIAAAVDRFVDARAMSDMDVAQLARSLDVDIAVDLAGFTTDSRPGIFALRAAPVQVSYLGYLGTSGAPYIDYLVADPTTVPDADCRHYTEKIAWLPRYYPDDATRRMADRIPERAALGLPAEGFVFCCFNNNYKIVPEAFERWMAILKQVPESVLFLYGENPWAEANLRKEATARGVGPARIVFGERLPRDDYLARYRAADLFLDTLPYNAGTTASDALWAGLPVLTLAGDTFAGRAAASLLHANGLPELVTATPAAFVAAAVELAADPARLRALRQRLDRRRTAAPSSPHPSFASYLETAYRAMHDRHCAGRPPDHIRVPA